MGETEGDVDTNGELEELTISMTECVGLKRSSRATLKITQQFVPESKSGWNYITQTFNFFVSSSA